MAPMEERKRIANFTPQLESLPGQLTEGTHEPVLLMWKGHVSMPRQHAAQTRHESTTSKDEREVHRCVTIDTVRHRAY